MSNEPNIQLAYPTQRIVGIERGAPASHGTPTGAYGELVEG